MEEILSQFFSHISCKVKDFDKYEIHLNLVVKDNLCLQSRKSFEDAALIAGYNSLSFIPQSTAISYKYYSHKKDDLSQAHTTHVMIIDFGYSETNVMFININKHHSDLIYLENIDIGVRDFDSTFLDFIKTKIWTVFNQNISSDRKNFIRVFREV